MTRNVATFAHMSVGTNDLKRATAFYDAVLATLGLARLVTQPDAVAYGRGSPDFWIVRPLNEARATVGNGTHIAFRSARVADVDSFYTAGIAAGGLDEGKPGRRATYGAGYYGCFIRDPDGHKIEAMFWDG